MPAMIYIRTLGPAEVQIDGEAAPPELLQRKNLALLVYLARSPHRRRSREHLTGLLWGDKPEAKARHSLREAARILRRVLGDDGLEADVDRLAVAEGLVELDVDWLEHLQADGDWEAAAALVGGEFLEGVSVKDAWPFEEWLGSERLRWRAASVRALVGRAEECMARGGVDEAMSLTERARALDPASGPAVRVAMKAQALSGNRAAALAHYEALRMHLEEAGSEPDPETAELAARVRREREWQLAPSVPKDASVGAQLRRPPLIGREEELGRLTVAWEEVVSRGGAAVAVIAGDVGYGKTRLAEELIARARLSGASIGAVRGVESDRDRGGSGILGLARGGLLGGSGLAAAAPGALATFAHEITEWADRFGSPAGNRQPLDVAFIEILRALAAEQPVFLCVDDVQWCDRDTLLALLAALRDLADLPLLVCLTESGSASRPELDDMRSRIGRDLHGVTVVLDRLEDEAVRKLARWAVPEYTDDQVDRLARRIASDSAGLPILAVELLHAVALGLDLEETQGAWPEPLRTLSQTMPGDLPDTIVAAIRVGFRRLSGNAQSALAAAAVLDERVQAEIIGRCIGVTGTELDAALDELEWQRWLTADARGYSFVARIVQEVVAEDMVTEGQKLRIRQAAQQV